jgi:hypothetical protein
MRARLCLSLFAFAHLCAVAIAQEQPSAVISPSSVGGATYITHATVVDTETGKEIQDRTVVISGGRISEVRDSKGMKPPAGAKVVDGRGRYLIPGLWDMHVHALFPERVDSMFPMFVANGVLGIRDMGTSMPLADIERLRQIRRLQAVRGLAHPSSLPDPFWTDARNPCGPIFLPSPRRNRAGPR